MPEQLGQDEDERWHDPALAEVFRLVKERAGEVDEAPPPWQLTRLHGRYASG